MAQKARSSVSGNLAGYHRYAPAGANEEARASEDLPLSDGQKGRLCIYVDKPRHSGQILRNLRSNLGIYLKHVRAGRCA